MSTGFGDNWESRDFSLILWFTLYLSFSQCDLDYIFQSFQTIYKESIHWKKCKSKYLKIIVFNYENFIVYNLLIVTQRQLFFFFNSSKTTHDFYQKIWVNRRLEDLEIFFFIKFTNHKEQWLLKKFGNLTIKKIYFSEIFESSLAQ